MIWLDRSILQNASLCMWFIIILAVTRENLSLEFLTKLDSNQSARLLKLARIEILHVATLAIILPLR